MPMGGCCRGLRVDYNDEGLVWKGLIYLLIASENLNDILGTENLVVFDCRFQLADVNAGREAYFRGHIPGAYYLDLERDLSSSKSTHGGRHPLPNPTALADLFGTAGVTDGVTVVVYDGGEGIATRAWWLLRWLGHDDVLVLNGGYRGWTNKGFSVSTELPDPKPVRFPVRLRNEWVVGLEEIESVVENSKGCILVDARAPERYRGEVEPIDVIGGHIPGAINRPWTENLTQNGDWKTPYVLKQDFALVTEDSEGATPVEWVNYCGSGVTACANIFALTLAGETNLRLYAGSWSDWCSYKEHAVTKGPTPTSRLR